MRSVINNNKKVFFLMRKNRANILKKYDNTEENSASAGSALKEKELSYFDDGMTEEQAKEAFLYNSKNNASKVLEKYL